MAADKNSLMDLKSELNALKSDLGDEQAADDNDASGEMMDLKRRMDKADQEMRAMTEAMKSTLLDVRALMQDMDNPFNMLRDMGVDKLVNKAVETVEDEVNKQKRDEAKKRMASDKDPNSLVAQLAGQTAPAPTSAGYAGGSSAPQYAAPAMQQPGPLQASTQAPAPSYSSPSLVSDYGGNMPLIGQPSGFGSQAPVGGGVSASVEENVQSLMRRVSVTEQAVPLILKRVSRTEEVVGELNEAVQELIEDMRGDGRRSRKGGSRRVSDYVRGIDSDEAKSPGEVYYEAYVSLVADYLVLRFGEKGAEEILLEGMYKGWASPRVVRDIMDHTATNAKTKDIRASLPLGIGQMNNDLEDKILLTSLLKNLDKPVSEWSEPTHLFLLLALVTRARENKLNRSEP